MPKYLPYKEAKGSDRRQRKAARRGIFDHNRELHSTRAKREAKEALKLLGGK